MNHSVSFRKITFGRLLPILCLLLLYMFSRMYHLLALPPFIDESIHIQWASDVYRGRFLTGAENGRLLALWWIALFQLSGDGVLWVTRTATLLVCLINVALLYSLGKTLVSRFAGILAASLYILAPFALFYDRITMPDSYVGTFGLLSLWFCVRYIRQNRAFDGVLAGIALTAGILAKAQGVMLIVIPALAIGLLIPLRPRSHWRTLARGLALAYGGFLLTWGPLYVYMIRRGYNYFGVATTYVGTAKVAGFAERIITNLQIAVQIDAGYFSVGLLALLALLTVYLIVRRWRIGLCLTACVILPLIMLFAFTNVVRARYDAFHVPLLILLLAVGLGTLALDLQRQGGVLRSLAVPGVVAVIVLWALLVALPFQTAMHSDPSAAAMPAEDRIEYVSADSSGFALNKVATYLLDNATTNPKPLRVIGLVSNCSGLDLSIPDRRNVTVECPYINFNGSEQPKIAALVNQRGAERPAFDLWIVSENVPYISLDGITIPYDPIITFDRPDGVSHVTLYHAR
ncbi:MAG: glycosyltransferase family 39 protein [Chloroflexota bacterium]